MALARLVLEAAACTDPDRARLVLRTADRAGQALAQRSRLRGASLGETMGDMLVLRHRVIALLDGSRPDEAERADSAIDALLVALVQAYAAAGSVQSTASGPIVMPTAP